ncbi:MAG: cobalamin-dependent protein [Gemmatimonadaceae bacterium]|nr:cobalamin-dependent protein [Gemmatimonadaceae bacterium]
MTSNAPNNDQRHPIAVVAERTGLTQDVLRVWERRYDAVTPTRSDGGLRLYSDHDIERLSLLRSAARAGRGIGQIAQLSTNALEVLVAEDEAAREKRGRAVNITPDASDVVGVSLALARLLDASALDDALRRAAMVMGMPVFLETVAAPLLRKVGDEWHAGRLSPAHEHLVTSSLHDIVVAMMRAFPSRKGSPSVLVATAAGERHVIGASLVGAAAALEGWNVVYLGANLPASDIAEAAKSAGVRVVAVSIIYVENPKLVLAEMRMLRERLPAEIALVAGGAGAVSIARQLEGMNVKLESSVPGFLGALRRDGDVL